MADLEFGLHIWVYGNGNHTSPEAFTDLARTAEDVGIDTLWVGDHIIFSEGIDSYFADHAIGPPSEFRLDQVCYESLSVLTYLAGKTDELKLGTNACVATMRSPVELVKRIFSMEALTDGRFELGTVPGWLDVEYETLGVPHDRRGERLDEFLDVLTRAREEAEFAYDGPFHSFPTAGFHPTPAEGRPGIYVGGFVDSSFRRAAQYADGWLPYGLSADEIAEGRDRLLVEWDRFDRDGDPEIAAAHPGYVGTDGTWRIETDETHGMDWGFHGEPAEIAEDVEAYADAGVTHFTIDLYYGGASDLEEQLEQIRRYADGVMSAF